ncbi:hypothetical protein GFS24_28055 [Chitinophaga sp. SYP-B3965]|uniref:hypothetical protein n=1 Tax=Chitinophaga sp. SYP-B3965 TaxID=2663120 RepID=UPI001299564E|nr:hypothetical protein [Chitinophaga sp. SYP-B3965]MRG48995.1 hypothetical protein [Chitinophaga sp. SYP-B3965]
MLPGQILLPTDGWGISSLCLLVCLGYAFVWRKRNSLVFFQSLIAYALAFDLASFGWQKICHLQMVVPLGVLDLPFNSLDGETLTWAYFRRSYPYMVPLPFHRWVVLICSCGQEPGCSV